MGRPAVTPERGVRRGPDADTAGRLSWAVASRQFAQSMISFRNLALRRGSRTLLSQMDLTIQSGWSLGVIGRNGCGKSTLFAALKGELEPEVGDLDMPSKVRLASVAQETPALPDPAIDYVLGGDVEVAAVLKAEAEAYEREDYEAVAVANQRIEDLNGYDARARAGRLMHGLGFSPDTHERAVASFSGGWRVRLNLARALMAPSDLLLLDEPTNHLDLDAVLWLEEWLRRYPGTLLIISHDREVLDGVISHTMHLHDGTAKLYTGNYTAFERQRAEHLRQQQIAHVREQAERAHLQSFIDRFKAKASKAKQAQSRMKRLEKLAGTEAVRAERSFSFSFPTPDRLPTSMLQLDHIDAGYGEHVVLRDVAFGLESGDRIGLLGPNGAGKTTTLRMLYTLMRPDAGQVLVDGVDAYRDALAVRRRLGVLPDARGLYKRLTATENIDYFGRLHGMSSDLLARRREVLIDALEMRDIADRRTEGFSQGQRVKTAIARALIHDPRNVLLDEPTNGLDVMATRAMRRFMRQLRDEGRCVLFSSHIMQEVAALCDRIVVIAQGRVVADETPAALLAQTGQATLEDAFVSIIGTDEGLAA